MTPRISPRFPPRRASSYEMFRDNPEHAPVETRAFWNYASAPGAFDVDSSDLAEFVLSDEEYRVLSKGASGGGFMVPTEHGHRPVGVVPWAGGAHSAPGIAATAGRGPLPEGCTSPRGEIP